MIIIQHASTNPVAKTAKTSTNKQIASYQNMILYLDKKNKEPKA